MLLRLRCGRQESLQHTPWNEESRIHGERRGLSICVAVLLEEAWGKDNYTTSHRQESCGAWWINCFQIHSKGHPNIRQKAPQESCLYRVWCINIFTRRLEKYSDRGFAIAVPGLLHECVSKRIKDTPYIYIPKYDLLVKVGALLPGRLNEVAYTENPFTQKQGALKLRAKVQQTAEAVTGLVRLIVLDLGLARYVNAPSNWLCEKRGKIVCDNNPYSCHCAPISTGRAGE